ncbi:putative baseplate hub subunit and tail lysozyme protein [Rhizobium phage RHph_I20]|uniref:Putative baseplate hub subunit and tail lysozyme protein n=1 Tax=Rhizobium phage RHph_I20 TaxID=2509730 RepID=A0A7S5RBJ8_9CAUD|nr:putative baseplate hub subunit and tail lysozyme protein [Rhizobium phage RHph_I20]
MTTKFPKGYEYLGAVAGPKHMLEALLLLGTVEVPGSKNSPVIMTWATELGLDRAYTGDDVPWCGLFAAICMKRAGRQPVTNPLWALNWSKFGIASPLPSFGDILVKKRKTATGWAGHVTFIVGEDATHYHCLGGNQSDAVCITRIAKKDAYAIRRPAYVNTPADVKIVKLKATGKTGGSEA